MLTNTGRLRGKLRGGASGTEDYSALKNKPQINGVELVGNKSLDDLGIDIPTKTSELDNDSGYVNSSIIANAYDETSTYEVGEYVTHENNLYKCNTAITTAEEWNAEHWTLVDVISATKSQVDEEIENAFVRENTVSGSVANFTTPVENAILKAVFGIVGTQESGTPTPSSPKAITTYNQAIITQADGNMVTQETYTIPFNSNCANGELTLEDKGNGYASVKLRTVKKGYDLSTLSWQLHNQGFYYADLPSDLMRYDSTVVPDIIAEKYQAQTAQWIYGHGTTYGYIAINGNKLWVTDSTTPSGIFVGYLTEPSEVDLTDIESIITLLGENNIYSDTNGNATITYKVSIEDKINMKADKSSVYTKEEVDELITRVDDQGLYIQAKKDTLSSPATFPPKIDNKKNSVLEFIGYFSSFTSLTFGHGYGSVSGSYVVVDNTNVTVYYSAPAQQRAQSAHGLTISDFIHIAIKQYDKAHADVQITTVSGSFELTNVTWVGCQGSVYANPATSMSDVVVNAVYRDFNENIFIYGDSYVSLDDSARYPYYLVKNDYTHFLLDGWAGRASGDALISFKNTIDLVVPKFVVWAIGMNNSDNGSVNANWLADTQEMLSICREKGIIPILTVTPNTPTHDNTYKNAWVKASGYRYIDFAKAVGAEEPESTWYAGMLYTDNVHPTSLGAKALYARLISDFPEIMK